MSEMFSLLSVQYTALFIPNANRQPVFKPHHPARHRAVDCL